MRAAMLFNDSAIFAEALLLPDAMLLIYATIRLIIVHRLRSAAAAAFTI